MGVQLVIAGDGSQTVYYLTVNPASPPCYVSGVSAAIKISLFGTGFVDKAIKIIILVEVTRKSNIINQQRQFCPLM